MADEVVAARSLKPVVPLEQLLVVQGSGQPVAAVETVGSNYQRGEFRHYWVAESQYQEDP